MRSGKRDKTLFQPEEIAVDLVVTKGIQGQRNGLHNVAVRG